ncbi:unnamed protein product [Clonostachys rosea f. rosea IK726]|uniref:Uncharacterized protein n=1 Tax=Clonostachys rosea f. rosea IK726 TaxID=1349383 RepID=A0ACA9UNS9_BIOOC|nr:unnamed protein product [Clonostachys rosea f. rosea IK726]
MAHTSNIPPVLLTQQSQGHDTSVQPRSKSPVSLIISRCAQPTFGPTSEAFTSLSQFLTGQWTTAEQGLNIIERQLKLWPESLVSQVSNPPFIHWRHCGASQRSEALATVMAILPLHISQTTQSHSILKKSVASQVKHIYSKAVKYPPSESLAAFQASILYSIMRTLCDSATLVPMIDEQTVRISQHILAKNVHCIDPDTNVQRGSWDDWVMEESMRRTFFYKYGI